MKIKVFIMITVLSVLYATNSFADPYEFIKGVCSNCKDFIKDSSRPDFTPTDEMIVTNYTICTKPEIMKNLSSAEKSHFENLGSRIEKAKKNLSPEQLARIKGYDDYLTNHLKILQNAVAPQDLSKLTKEEMAELDKQLKSIFWKMIDALKSNNIELALSYFSDYSKDKHRKMFGVLSKEAIQEVIRNTREISLTSIRGNTVHYEMTANENGKEYLYPLDFVQDLDGKWRISEY